MKKFVLNAIFSSDMQDVLIIKKNRPDWQAGKFNFIGGKVETKETFIEAALRETKEECGLDIDYDQINQRGVIRCSMHKWMVMCFVSITDDIYDFQSLTDEPVFITCVKHLKRMDKELLVDTFPSLLELSLLDDERFAFDLIYRDFQV